METHDGSGVIVIVDILGSNVSGSNHIVPMLNKRLQSECVKCSSPNVLDVTPDTCYMIITPGEVLT